MHRVYAFNFGGSDNGNVSSITNCRDTTRSQSFTYDNLNRITSAQSSGPQWGETYTIDAWGNLTNIGGISGKTYSETLNAAPATNANQLTSYGYDTAGNIITNASTTYVYDAENRLVWTTGGYRYLYDGDGNRVEKCVAGSATTPCPTSGTNGTLYWMGAGTAALDESDLSGNMLEQYVFFAGQRVARRDVSTGAVHYYFSDHLGTHAVVENATGTAVEQDIDYYPYGGVEEDYSTTQVAQHYKFTGKERDTESGLDNFGARYFTSTLGRFMTPDWAGRPTTVPYANFGDPQSLNLYTYVDNAPLTRIDAVGHVAEYATGSDAFAVGETEQEHQDAEDDALEGVTPEQKEAVASVSATPAQKTTTVSFSQQASTKDADGNTVTVITTVSLTFGSGKDNAGTFLGGFKDVETQVTAPDGSPANVAGGNDNTTVTHISQKEAVSAIGSRAFTDAQGSAKPSFASQLVSNFRWSWKDTGHAAAAVGLGALGVGCAIGEPCGVIAGIGAVAGVVEGGAAVKDALDEGGH